ncbi:MAG: YraN family protein [Planctomycetota bacterium]
MGFKNKLTGSLGEEKAVEIIKKNGYRIIQQNYQAVGCEIDIIGEKDKTLVFIEVKTRTSFIKGFPEDSITAAKARNISFAALNYIKENKIRNVNIRCDVVCLVLGDAGVPEYCKIYEDALDLEGAYRKKRWFN